MAIPYICSSCRQSLARRLRRRTAYQWPVRATQSSVAAKGTINALDGVPNTRSRTLAVESSSPNQDVIPGMLDDLYTQLSISNLPRAGRYSKMAGKSNNRGLRAHKSSTAVRKALAEFQGRKSSAHEVGGAQKITISENFKAEVGLPATELKYRREEESISGQLTRRILETKPGSSQRLWSFFRRSYPNRDCMNLRNPALLDIPKLKNGRLFSRVLDHLTRQWLESLDSKVPVRPSPVEVILKFEELSIMRPVHWAEILQLLSLKMVALNNEASIESSNSDKVKHLHETTMAAWRMCLRTYIRSPSGDKISSSSHTETSLSPPNASMVHLSDSKDPSGSTMSNSNRLHIDWSFLPGHESLNLIARAGTRPDFGSRFFRYLSRYPIRSDYRLSTAALVTFIVLRHWFDSGWITQEQESHISPFTSFIAHLLPYSDMDYELKRVEKTLRRQKVDSLAVNKIENLLRDAHTAALAEIGSKSRPDYRNLPYQKTMSKKDKNLETFFVRRMHRCMWKKNADQADKLWKEIQRTFDSDVINGQKSRIPARLFNEFMVLFHSIRLPKKAAEVWSYMNLHGVEQTVATWTAMMKGCQLTREYESSEKIWQKMLDSGIRADEQAWAVRIYTLFHSKQVREGMDALADMTDNWLDSQSQLSRNDNKETYSTPKPNTRIFNAALSGLTKYHMTNMVRRLLSWAKELKIEYDAVTYNILIRSALSEDNNEEATHLLQEMGRQGIEPNIALFSILLDSLFRNSSEMESMTDDQLAERVLAILSQLDSYGAHGNAYPYTVLIGGLIHVRRNPAAAQTVLDHMGSRNIRPSPHIYSSLMTYYFSQPEPDEGAINALWEQIQAGGHADAILYDRMVENYAATGDIGRMMTFLQKMPKEGRSSSWRSLTAAVQALAEAGHWDRFDEVVESVRGAEDTITNIGWIEYGKDIFWGEVDRLRAGMHPMNLDNAAEEMWTVY